jgi:hypothetical protein
MPLAVLGDITTQIAGNSIPLTLWIVCAGWPLAGAVDSASAKLAGQSIFLAEGPRKLPQLAVDAAAEAVDRLVRIAYYFPEPSDDFEIDRITIPRLVYDQLLESCCKAALSTAARVEWRSRARATALASLKSSSPRRKRARVGNCLVRLDRAAKPMTLEHSRDCGSCLPVEAFEWQSLRRRERLDRAILLVGD